MFYDVCDLAFLICVSSPNIKPTFSLSGILDLGVGCSLLGFRIPTRGISWEAITVFTSSDIYIYIHFALKWFSFLCFDIFKVQGVYIGEEY